MAAEIFREFLFLHSRIDADSHNNIINLFHRSRHLAKHPHQFLPMIENIVGPLDTCISKSETADTAADSYCCKERAL